MTATILDFAEAQRHRLARGLMDNLIGNLIDRFEFIANASDAELDEYERTLSPEARAFAGLVFPANDTARDLQP